MTQLTFRYDSETLPIRPGLLAPRLVCLQSALDIDGPAARDGEVLIQLPEQALERVEAALDNPKILLEALNGSFDQAVLCSCWPHLVPKWFKALGDGRGRDVMLREQLIEIRHGTMQDRHPKGYWGLAGIAKRRCGIEIAKGEETWRLRYGLLEGQDPSGWPIEPVEYAAGDVTHLRTVSRSQLKDYVPPDEWLQVAAAFCLQLAALWGLRVDPAKLRAAQTRFLADKAEAAEVLEQAGLFRDGHVNQAAVRAAVVRACASARLPVPRSDPSGRFPDGQVKMDADTCESLKNHDPALTSLSQHNTSNKMLETYLAPMEHGVRYAMTSRPNALVATGRTSWGGAKLKEYNPWWPEGTVVPKTPTKVGTNLQNWPQDLGIRDCVIPRDGYYFASVDYNSLELRTLGQVCLWLVGSSTFAKGYQEDPDWDPHSYFGGQLIGISYEEALIRKKTDPSFKNGARAVGKAANFSLPGGSGARRLAVMFQTLFEQGDLPKPYTVEECQEIKDAYFVAYPEMRAYFDYVAGLQETGQPLIQFVSNRVRGNITYSSGANSFFQGLAADLAKRAMFYVSLACYTDTNSPLFGSRVVAFIHDELLLEVPIPVASEATLECERLMVCAANEISPDVPYAAEGCLMTHWNKAAAPKWADGKLIPYC